MQRMRFYTDGACSGNPGPGGWAVVQNRDEDYKTYCGNEQDTTNNRMELQAVIQVLLIAADDVQPKRYEVVSDSAYVVNALTKGWLENWKRNGWKTKQHEDVKNADMWVLTYSLLKQAKKNGHELRFLKVKGHDGNTYNELADKLAREESMKAQAKSKR